VRRARRRAPGGGGVTGGRPRRRVRAAHRAAGGGPGRVVPLGPVGRRGSRRHRGSPSVARGGLPGPDERAGILSSTSDTTGGHAPRGLRMVLHQYRYDQKMFWREPASVFFTVALPIIFLFLFASIFGDHDVKVGGGRINGVTYYVPSILTLAIVSATLL